MLAQRGQRQQLHQAACLAQAIGAPQQLHFTIGQLDRFGHQVALEQDLDGELVRASVTGDGGELAASVGQTLGSKALGGSAQQESPERWRVCLSIRAPVEQNVGERQ